MNTVRNYASGKPSDPLRGYSYVHDSNLRQPRQIAATMHKMLSVTTVIVVVVVVIVVVVVVVHFALRPQKRDGLLGTGTGGGEGDERVMAQPRKPPEKDRRDRGPPPEQWKCQGGVPLPLPSDLCTAQLLFQLPCWAESLDNVRCTAVEEQLEAKKVTQSSLYCILYWHQSSLYSIPY